jgi:hypothetical protein
MAAGQWPGFIAQSRKQFDRVGQRRRPVIAEWARDHASPPFVLWAPFGLARILVAKSVFTFAEYARRECADVGRHVLSTRFRLQEGGHKLREFARDAEFLARSASALAT